MTLENAIGTIGYPRALHFYEFYPFFREFFERIGWNVVPSPDTTERIVARADELAPSQTCLAQKLAYAHTSVLLDDPSIDRVFIPALISGEEYNDVHDSHMCVYVQGNKGLQIARFGDHAKFLAPVLEFRKGKRDTLYRQLESVARELNPSADGSAAIDYAFAAERKFQQQLLGIGQDAMRQALERGTPLFVMLARYYVARDLRLKSDIDHIVQDKGYDCISMDMLPLHEIVREPEFLDLHGHVYWNYHVRMLAAAHYVRKHPFIKPIYVTCFPCGPDSFIIDEVKNILGGSMLTIKVDSADMSANIRTRVESYVNTIANRGAKKDAVRELEDPLRLYNPLTDAEGRVLLFNLMCDHGQPFAAVMRGWGVPAYCFEPNNDETLLVGKKFTDDGACIPCAETGGHFYRSIMSGRVRLDRPGIVLDSKFADALGPVDVVNVDGKEVVEASFDPRRFAFFQGTAAGPCRYGQYMNQQSRRVLEIHRRKLIQEMVAEGRSLADILASPRYQDNPFRFFTLNAANYYSLAGLNFVDRIKLQADLWKGIRAIDSLQKAASIQRVREVTPGDVDAIYESTLHGICERMENRNEYLDLIYDAARELMRVPVRDQPPVFDQVVGEVYVRLNEHINRGIVRALETDGIGSIMSPFGMWVKYIAALQRRDLEERREESSALGVVPLWVQSYLLHRKHEYQSNKERLYEVPFLPIVGRFPDPPIDDVLNEGSKYLDLAFRGEAIISAAELSLAMHHGFSGAVNLMPFTCMPSNVVAGLEMRIRGNNEQFPIDHFEYDGSPDIAYGERLAAHAFQVHNYFDQNADAIVAVQKARLDEARAEYMNESDPEHRVPPSLLESLA